MEEDTVSDSTIIEVRPTSGSWVAPADQLPKFIRERTRRTSEDIPPRTREYINGIRLAAIDNDVYFYFEPEEGYSSSGLCINISSMDTIAALWCASRYIDPDDYVRKTRRSAIIE